MIVDCENHFDKRQTSIAKGIACLLLLWHHLFFNNQSNYSLFTSVHLMSDNTPIECYLAYFMKICVPIFLLLSGYGINEKFKTNREKALFHSLLQDVRLSMAMLLKLLSNFWFIFILFMPWQSLLGHTPPYANPTEFLLDFFGLSYITGGNTMNATWWYISVAVVSYILSPYFRFFTKRFPAYVLGISLFVLFGPFSLGGIERWVAIFVLGMLVSETDIFSHFNKIKEQHILKTVPLCIILIATSFYLFIRIDSDLYYTSRLQFAMVVLFVSYSLISNIKIISFLLEFIGKHSGNIFMFHTFIYSIDFKEFVYAPKYSVLIYVLFVIECLIISMAIEKLKKIIRYDKLINNIQLKIMGVKAK